MCSVRTPSGRGNARSLHWAGTGRRVATTLLALRCLSWEHARAGDGPAGGQFPGQ